MAKRLCIVCLVAFVCCSGCFRVLIPVSSRWPEIKYPERPNIVIPEDGTPDAEAAQAYLKSTYVYSRHIETLEQVIRSYNAEAKVHNDEVHNILFGDK